MSLKQLLKKITLATLLAGATFTITNSAMAQFLYYYPSASFFSPFAHGFQSADDAVDLATILEDEKFATFNSSLEEAGLLKTIEQEDLLTVLAPTEEAFAALSPELKQKLSDSETMKQVLQYHLILGSIGEEEIQRREVATLLEQNSVKITGVPTEKDKMTVKLNQATASKPLGAVNGVIIPIDEVLIPQGL